MKFIYNLYFVYYLILFCNLNIFAWSELHIFNNLNNNSNYNINYRAKKLWLLEKKDILPFNQLILSWNAFRPYRGNYRFSVQSRDSLTKRWYSWHTAAIWGNNIQKSFTSKTRNGTQFLYVRLELPKNSFADSFRIKVNSYNCAKLSDIASICVNTINLSKFISETRKKNIYNLPSVFIEAVPKKSQQLINHPKSNSLCSPTSTTMLLGFLLKKNINPLDTANGVYDKGLDVYGNWSFNTAYAYDQSEGKYNFHVERLKSFSDLHDSLKKSLPVIVSVTGPMRGAAGNYRCGHLLVVVGYNNKTKKVLCHDPAFKSKILVEYNLASFLKAWERSRRLSYIVTKNR